MATLIKGRRVVSENPHSPEKGEVLRLEPGDEPAAIVERLGRVARVEVNFPKFGDGRGYSIARLLRERYGYRGELRAVGHITRDLLFFLESCGFDAFELREGENPHEALAAFEDFSESYQASVTRPLPLFRRRVA
jgi:uncharacterized protein (DUF934 family)